jgi:hypothetical protein
MVKSCLKSELDTHAREADTPEAYPTLPVSNRSVAMENQTQAGRLWYFRFRFGIVLLCPSRRVCGKALASDLDKSVSRTSRENAAVCGSVFA